MVGTRKSQECSRRDGRGQHAQLMLLCTQGPKYPSLSPGNHTGVSAIESFRSVEEGHTQSPLLYWFLAPLILYGVGETCRHQAPALILVAKMIVKQMCKVCEQIRSTRSFGG